MKKSLLTLTVMLVAAALIIVFSGPAAAKVTGVCSGCHTMHDSQGGSAMAAGGPHATLLMNDCVGCHSDSDSSTTYELGGCTVPVVNYTGSGAPSTYLAGGNFYWVQTEGGTDMSDAKGHNVFASNPDGTLTAAPGDPGMAGCNCHGSLATADSGCQGCHREPAHHADDSATVIGAAANSTDGYYRFLSGHMSGGGKGVCGIEDSDWQASNGASDHNEYLGNALNLSSSANMSSLGHTMTGYCCGCHGNFHNENTATDGSGEWIRHPSDAVIPNSGEYADAFGTSHVYDPDVPVARPSLTGWTDPSGTVAIGTDMVMCLSCHRPHGSPYDDLLRWQYNGTGGMIAGSGESSTGCFACHTKKDTGG